MVLMADCGQTNILPVQHTSFVLHRLNEQRNKGMFCDATLIVEGEKFRVHRSFLAANSDYFLSLFASAEEQVYFVLAGVPLQGFRVILDFIYSSTFVLNVSNIHDVYKASSALNFNHVQTACEKVFQNIKQLEKTKTAAGKKDKPERKMLSGGISDDPIDLSPTPGSPKGGSSSLRPPANPKTSSVSHNSKANSNPSLSDGSSSPGNFSVRESPQRGKSASPRSVGSFEEDVSPVVQSIGFIPASHLKRPIKMEFEKENAITAGVGAAKRMALPFRDLERKINCKTSIEQTRDGSRLSRTTPPFSQESNGYQEETLSLNRNLKCPGGQKDFRKPYFLSVSVNEPLIVFGSHSAENLRNSREDRSDDSNSSPQNLHKSISESNNFSCETLFVNNVQSESNPIELKSKPFTCSFRTSVEAASSLVNHNKRNGNAKATESCDHVFSNWKLVPNKDRKNSPERLVKTHRNRRKLLKTNKVYTNSS